VIRIAYLGNTAVSAVVLRAVAGSAGVALELVVTRPPRPARRGAGTRPTEVARAARDLGLPLVEVERAASPEGLAALREARPEALAVVAVGELLPPEVLSVGARGAVNVHLSLLPRWRGAAPVARAILAGDVTTGVTTMLMDAGLDTGPILEQRSRAIGGEEDAGALEGALAELGGGLLASTLAGLDRIDPAPQDDALATFAPKLTDADRPLDWTRSAGELVRRVRALAPAPGATAGFRAERLKVLSARASTAAGEPGAIGPTDGDAVAVGTADGTLLLERVVPPGRRATTGAAWARGARPRPGERLS